VSFDFAACSPKNSVYRCSAGVSPAVDAGVSPASGRTGRRGRTISTLLRGQFLLLALALATSGRAQNTSPVIPAAAPNGSIDSNDPLLQPPPLPSGKVSLMGGRVGKVDKVHQTVTVKPFGNGSHMKIYFDERTHIFRDGVETTMLGIHPGERIYVDTLSDGGHVLAKSIRVVTHAEADARGQILAYDPRHGRLAIQDQISSMAVKFRLAGDTVIRRQDEAGSPADLLTGSLVQVRFAQGDKNRDLVREVDILAAPGSTFTFVGPVTYLDMSRKVLAVQNRSDDNSYELHFDPSTGAYDHLTVGSEVNISARFDGSQYFADRMMVQEKRPQPSK